jgi:hypothetical protein
VAKVPGATFGKCFLAWFLAGVAGILINWIFIRWIPILGWLGSIPLAWLIIKWVLKTSFGKAVLSWLLTLALCIPVIPLSTILVFSPAMNEALETTTQLAYCLDNLREIREQCSLYTSEHNNQFPPDLDTLAKKSNKPSLLKCPSSPLNGCSYFYLAPLADSDPQCMIACDYWCNHGEDRNVLLKDGTVTLMKAEQFSQELAKPFNARFAAALAETEGSLKTQMSTSQPQGQPR